MHFQIALLLPPLMLSCLGSAPRVGAVGGTVFVWDNKHDKTEIFPKASKIIIYI